MNKGLLEDNLSELWKEKNPLGTSDLSDAALVNSPVRSCHDWRNYVPESIAQFWSTLTVRERLLVALVCEGQAIMEDWE